MKGPKTADKQGQLTTGKGKEPMEDLADLPLTPDVIQPDRIIDPPRRIRQEKRNTEYVMDKPSATNNYATLLERGPSQMLGPNHNHCKQPPPLHCPLAAVNMLLTVVIIKRCPGMWF